jgi:hypothetical protein
LLGLRVRIPPGAWMSVSCECCVLSGRGLCDRLITRPEESYRVPLTSVKINKCYIHRINIVAVRNAKCHQAKWRQNGKFINIYYQGQNFSAVKSEFSTVVSVKVAVFWDVALCNFEVTCCFHVQGKTWTQPFSRNVSGCVYLPTHLVSYSKILWSQIIFLWLSTQSSCDVSRVIGVNHSRVIVASVCMVGLPQNKS